MSRAGFPLAVLFCAAAALAAAPARAEAGPESDAMFLGMAVADSVGRDTNGHVVLSGIHHVSHVSGFPYTGNLSVYTRWSGTGVHDIGISIWNLDTEETVSETEKSVTFSDSGVTTFTYTFISATFKEKGTYDVETTLDGDLAAEYSLFFDTDDSFPSTPQLVLSVPAAQGAVDPPDGASVKGIPDAFSFRGFPASESIDLVTVWFSGDSGHEQYMEILDPTGVPIAASSSQEIPADAGKLALLTDSFQDLTLPVRGTYTAVLYLDGEDIFEYPLPVTRQ